MSRKVAVVGATGFIGSYLVRHLTNQQDFEIEEFNSFRPVLENGQLNLGIIQANSVIWAASQTGPSECTEKSAERELTDWIDFLNSFKNSQDLNHAFIIFLSSGGCIYSDDKSYFDESDASNGVNLYGQLKNKMERALVQSNINHCILRLANVYGSNPNLGLGNGVISNWYKNIRAKRRIDVYGSLERARDYVHIEDVLIAIEMCILRQPTGIFNIGSGATTTLKELIEMFQQNMSEQLDFDLVSARTTDRVTYGLNCEKSLNHFSWQSSKDLSQSITELLNFRF